METRSFQTAIARHYTAKMLTGKVSHRILYHIQIIPAVYLHEGNPVLIYPWIQGKGPNCEGGSSGWTARYRWTDMNICKTCCAVSNMNCASLCYALKRYRGRVVLICRFNAEWTVSAACLIKASGSFFHALHRIFSDQGWLFPRNA